MTQKFVKFTERTEKIDYKKLQETIGDQNKHEMDLMKNLKMEQSSSIIVNYLV